ncbi:hypothetical protein M5D96_008713 [Drosophila gunungcola]|uniref:Uncharacterized protein n=1 Tax=Drosophila gunungcola TaxID=103775 RepID=A0A9P9YLC5_9MUSC|nr:hypothetical protein M5D96_008713 [Drosophila gunungcola]
MSGSTRKDRMRSGVIRTTPKAPKKGRASFKITELDRRSAASFSSRKSNRSGGDTKVAKISQDDRNRSFGN